MPCTRSCTRVVAIPSINTDWGTNGLKAALQRRACGILVNEKLDEAYKKDLERLFTKACSDRTRGSGCNLKEGRFRNMRKI